MSITSDQREQQRIAFINNAGWEGAAVEALPVDASARRYFRLAKGSETKIVMDAPPGIAEPVAVFAKVGRHLLSCGVSTPVIHHEDIENGFLLLEDFGDNTYAKLLNAGWDEEKLYKLAVDVLVTMHSSDKLAQIDMPPYDLAFLIKEALIMADWYVPSITGAALPAEARQAYVSAWCQVFKSLPLLPTTLVLRDFHIDNLMILDGREGVASCGLLDFQTAVLGVAPYDLMSLVEDARRDIDDGLRTRMINRYLKAMEIDRDSEDGDAFMSWYYALSAQRHAKVLGLFTRLYSRDQKDAYLKHVKRVSGLMSISLQNSILEPVKSWFDNYFPDYVVELEAETIDEQKVIKLAILTEDFPVSLS
ncbi:aminoglycoside phosphotransferase family protein [Kiloniella majae]|uniref:aminoglycoside phosphotransferase family protein n=1 Tax=Kiloniella majae TaxID=1938558 RepID=UPI0015C4E880|nr:phosphotransferase [Kiloniella majae]